MGESCTNTCGVISADTTISIVLLIAMGKKEKEISYRLHRKDETHYISSFITG